MWRHAFLALLIAIGHFLFTSSSALPRAAPIAFDDAYLNRQITLTAPSYFNDFKTTGSVGLELGYNAEDPIVFPANYNLRIFERTGTGWVEIGEQPTERYPAGDIVFSPEMNRAMDIVTLFPDLPDVSEPHRLRIYVLGSMQTAHSLKEVGAYVDLTLFP